MTYKELLAAINELSAEDLEKEVVVYMKQDDEFFVITSGDTSYDSDLFDEIQPILVVD